MKKFIILLLLISFCASPQQSENIPITTTTTQFQEVTTTFVTTTTLSVLEKEINTNFELTGIYETNEERIVREQNNPRICDNWSSTSAELKSYAVRYFSDSDDVKFEAEKNVRRGRSASSQVNRLSVIISNFDNKRIELSDMLPNIENNEAQKYLEDAFMSLENSLFTLKLFLQNEDLELMTKYQEYKNEFDLNIFKYEKEKQNCQFVKPTVNIECPYEINNVTQEIKFNIYSGSGKIVNVSIYLDINNGDEIINTYFERDLNSDLFSFPDEGQTNEYSYLIDSSTYNSETFYIFNVSVISEQSYGYLYDTRDFCYITYKP